MAVIIPSKDASVTTFLVDDTLGGLVSYSNGWELQGALGEFGSTTHAATTAGLTATFGFSGTGIVVFGTVRTVQAGDAGPTRSSYSIDGGTATQFTAPDTNITLYSIPFFQSPTLTTGQHVLTITFNGGRDYFLDYIQYSGPVQASTTTAGSTSTPSLNSPSTTVTVTTTSSPTVSDKSSTNTPAIAGAAVGAFFGGLIVALLCFLCFTYSRRKKQPSNPTLYAPEPHATQAFSTTSQSFNPSVLYASSLQPGFTQVPPTGRPSGDTSSTPGRSTSAVTSDGSNSHNHPPAYSKRREAFGTYAVTNAQ